MLHRRTKELLQVEVNGQAEAHCKRQHAGKKHYQRTAGRQRIEMSRNTAPQNNARTSRWQTTQHQQKGQTNNQKKNKEMKHELADEQRHVTSYIIESLLQTTTYGRQVIT